MKPTNYLLLCLALLGFFSSCEDDDNNFAPELEVPKTFAFERAGASTVSFTGQTARIGMADELTDALSDPNQSLTDLENKFRNPAGVDPFMNAALNASTKSVRSKVAASARLFSANTVAAAAIKADFDAFLSGQVTEVFPAWNEVAAPGQPGQIADGSSVRYVNGGGLEYNQAFAKGLIGALMYDQLANNYLDVAVLDAGTNRSDNDNGINVDGKPYTDMEHKWDEAFGYLFGASVTPATPLSDLGTADDFLNKYLGRVNDDPDFAGVAEEIELAFRTGRAAIVAGDYAERDRQATLIKDHLADVIAIRAIYYLMQGRAALEGNPQNLGGAFHDLSEGYGFVYALRFIDGNNSTSDAFLTALKNEAGNGFWDINPDALLGMANSIGLTYDIDVDQAAE